MQDMRLSNNVDGLMNAKDLSPPCINFVVLCLRQMTGLQKKQKIQISYQERKVSHGMPMQNSIKSLFTFQALLISRINTLRRRCSLVFASCLIQCGLAANNLCATENLQEFPCTPSRQKLDQILPHDCGFAKCNSLYILNVTFQYFISDLESHVWRILQLQVSAWNEHQLMQ